MDNKLELIFNETGIRCKMLDPETSAICYKNISLETLAEILNKDQYLDTGFLGILGDNYKAIRRYIIKGNRHIFLIESSPFVGSVRYESNSSSRQSKTYKAIPFPGLLMGVAMEKDGAHFKMRRTSLFALKTPATRDSTPLYQFPFANVYGGNSSKICWGGVNYKQSLYPEKVTSLMSLFLNAGMNDDLFNSRHPNHSRVSEYLDEIDGKGFDYSNLRELIPVKGLVTSLESRNL